MLNRKTSLILGGQARLPKELSAGEVFQVAVELDPAGNKVLAVSCGPCVSFQSLPIHP